jgi:hypothetical protein
MKVIEKFIYGTASDDETTTLSTRELYPKSPFFRS